jgi:hypothetical protein
MSHALISLFVWSPTAAAAGDLDEELASIASKAALIADGHSSTGSHSNINSNSNSDRAASIVIESKLAQRKVSKFLQKINDDLSHQSHHFLTFKFSDSNLLLLREANPSNIIDTETAPQYLAYRLDESAGTASLDAMMSNGLWTATCTRNSILGNVISLGQLSSSNNQKLAFIEIIRHEVQPSLIDVTQESFVMLVQDLLSKDSLSKLKIYSAAEKSDNWMLIRATVWTKACSLQ